MTSATQTVLPARSPDRWKLMLSHALTNCDMQNVAFTHHLRWNSANGGLDWRATIRAARQFAQAMPYVRSDRNAVSSATRHMLHLLGRHRAPSQTPARAAGTGGPTLMAMGQEAG